MKSAIEIVKNCIQIVATALHCMNKYNVALNLLAAELLLILVSNALKLCSIRVQ